MAILVYFDLSADYSPEIKYIVDLFFQTHGLSYTVVPTLQQLDESRLSSQNLLLLLADPARFQVLRKGSRSCRRNVVFVLNTSSTSLGHPGLSEIVEADYAELVDRQSNHSVPIPVRPPETEVVDDESTLYEIRVPGDDTHYPGITYAERTNVLTIHADLFTSAFYFISLAEESFISRRDRHGRLIASYCQNKRKDVLGRPLAEEYFDVLHRLILLVAQRAGLPLLWKCFWPGNEDYAVCLTHDVDVIPKWYLYSALRFLQLARKGDIGSIRKMARAVLKAIATGKNPADTFDTIMELEKKFAFSSSFYFMAGRQTLSSILKSDVTYDLRSPRIREIVDRIESNGFEVGLHGSYESHADYGKLREEKAVLDGILGEHEYGTRQHFARFEQPFTWEVQAGSGLLYDSTLGYADEIGYRAGFSYPFYPYHPKLRRSFPILELPFAIMDRTLSKYLGATAAEVWVRILDVISRARERGGVVTVIWHTHTGDAFGFAGYADVYRNLLRHLESENVFVGSGRDICKWWLARANVVCEGVSLREGRGTWRFRSGIRVDEITFAIGCANSSGHKVRVEGAQYDIAEGADALLVKIQGLSEDSTFSLTLS